MASLLDDTSDVDDALSFAEPFKWAKDPLNLTTDECWLRLLHVKIKHNATVLFNLGFEALPRANLPRLFKLQLLEHFVNSGTPTPLDFF